MANKGLEHLKSVLNGTTPQMSMAPFDEDSEVLSVLSTLEYVNHNDFDSDLYENHRTLRARIRYIAALFPYSDMNQLTQRVHATINNTNFEVSDIRLILQGRKLSDPSQLTNEVSITIIQGIGKCLREGKSLRQTAKDMKVSYDTVESIERYLGIRSKLKLKLIDDAVIAVREGYSIRKFADQSKVSRSTAQRLLNRGVAILKELGEIDGQQNQRQVK